MAKNRNQNRGRAASPARSTAPAQDPAALAGPPPQTPADSGLGQETSRKRRKRFGHN